jgi:hypothetical protein
MDISQYCVVPVKMINVSDVDPESKWNSRENCPHFSYLLFLS